MNTYRAHFRLPVQGYDQGVNCSIDFDADCDMEDAYVVGEALIAGVKGARYTYTELVE